MKNFMHICLCQFWGRSMKIETYLINLDGSHERLARASAQLNEVGWEFERYPAFDGRGKALSDFKHYNDVKAQKILGRSLLNSEIGCYLSHYGCIENFLKTDADYLIVLEDDLKISENFKSIMNEILEHLHSDSKTEWHLVNIAAKKKKIAKDIASINQYSLGHAYYFPIRGLGLIWSRKGAKAFLDSGREITVPVDIFFQNWLSENGRGLGVWPALVSPAGLDSDILGTIASQGVLRKQKEKRQLFYRLKKQKRVFVNKLFAMKNYLFH